MLSFRSENKDPQLESVLKTRGLSRIPAKFEIEFVLTIDHNFQSSFKQCPSYMYRDLDLHLQAWKHSKHITVFALIEGCCSSPKSADLFT